MNTKSYLLPGPGRTVYVVGLVTACKYCGGGPTIMIERHDNDSVEMDGYREDGTPLLPFDGNLALFDFPLLNPERFREKVGAELSSLRGDDGGPLGEIGGDFYAEEFWDELVDGRRHALVVGTA